MEQQKRKFKFYMTDPENNDEFSFEQTIDNYYVEVQDELDYLLEQFKSFLKACGWNEAAVKHLMNKR